MSIYALIKYIILSYVEDFFAANYVSIFHTEISLTRKVDLCVRETSEKNLQIKFSIFFTRMEEKKSRDLARVFLLRVEK